MAFFVKITHRQNFNKKDLHQQKQQRLPKTAYMAAKAP